MQGTMLVTPLSPLARGRRLLPRQATLAMLERMLSAFDEREQPLSVIRIEVKGTARATNRRLAKLLRRGLRTRDVVGDLWGRGLLVTLPNTGRASAEDLCGKLGHMLASAGAEHMVGSMETETADSREDLDQLVQWLRVRGLGFLGRGRALPQTAQSYIARAEHTDRSSMVQSPAGTFRLGDVFGDIAAMRNDRGGVIVLDVADKEAVAVGCLEVPLSHGEGRRMRQIAGDLLAWLLGPLRRGWRWFWHLAEVPLEPADHPHYRETAWSDTRVIARHWAFRTAVGIVAVTATVVVAEDTSSTGLPRITLLVLAAGAFAYLVCLVIIFLGSLQLAPHRQRCHARAS
jgi:hypothetical protein